MTYPHTVLAAIGSIKGSSFSLDCDGIVEARLSISDPDVAVVGPSSFSVKYGGFFTLEIAIRKKAGIDFYVDFFARDNDKGEIVKGDLKDIFCGRTKVVFAYTVTTDWETVAPVIAENKFVGWGYPGIEKNCFAYAVEQLKQAGHSLKSEGWFKYYPSEYNTLAAITTAHLLRINGKNLFLMVKEILAAGVISPKART